MKTTHKLYTSSEPFTTESSFTFTSPEFAYHSWGTLNQNKDNVVIIFHALTGNSDAESWFYGLFESNSFLNLDEQFVICVNHLGSCYGSTGPLSINPETNQSYQANFPKVTIRDLARFQQHLFDELGIREIELAIGGSMGGMVALEFSIIDERVKNLCILAMGKAHSPWAIGISTAQRQAIYADKNWNDGFYDPEFPPKQGLAAARAMAMITYRSFLNYESKFGRSYNQTSNKFEVESYLEYQGEKLVNRFDANSYVRLTQAMDTHDVSRGRESFEETLKNLKIPTLIIGIDSDLLYPPSEQQELASLIPNSVHREISSPNGHDAFLIEFEQINNHVVSFLNKYSVLQ